MGTMAPSPQQRHSTTPMGLCTLVHPQPQPSPRQPPATIDKAVAAYCAELQRLRALGERSSDARQVYMLTSQFL